MHRLGRKGQARVFLAEVGGLASASHWSQALAAASLSPPSVSSAFGPWGDSGTSVIVQRRMHSVRGSLFIRVSFECVLHGMRSTDDQRQ